MAVLPPPTTNLPRSRKVPGPKAMTKWEKFAKEKGIQKKKKDKKVFDETLEVSFSNSTNFKFLKFHSDLEMGSNLWLQTRRGTERKRMGLGGS